MDTSTRDRGPWEANSAPLARSQRKSRGRTRSRAPGCLLRRYTTRPSVYGARGSTRKANALPGLGLERDLRRLEIQLEGVLLDVRQVDRHVQHILRRVRQPYAPSIAGWGCPRLRTFVSSVSDERWAQRTSGCNVEDIVVVGEFRSRARWGDRFSEGEAAP